jgi:hypothetical protein
MLQDAIVSCEKINERRGNVVLRAFFVVKESQVPKLFKNSTQSIKKNLIVTWP